MKHLFPILTLATVFTMVSCSKADIEKDPNAIDIPQQNIPITAYDLTQIAYTTIFDFKPTVTKVERQDYNELSGIAASHINTGIFYMHNDAKNSPILITNAQGADLGKIILDGQSTIDPEDICVGPGPEKGKSYIYFADIGDNKNVRSSIAVYRLEEPLLKNPNADTQIHSNTVTKIVFNYPKGAFNAETIMIDPATKDLYIATKETNHSTVYKAAYPQYEKSNVILEPVVDMRFFDKLTAGDISSDGKEILLRNKGQIWYWQRQEGQSIAQTLLTAPQKAPYAGNEHQGEGICFTFGNTGYYTNTEIRDYPGAISNISYYQRK